MFSKKIKMSIFYSEKITEKLKEISTDDYKYLLNTINKKLPLQLIREKSFRKMIVKNENQKIRLKDYVITFKIIIISSDLIILILDMEKLEFLEYVWNI